MGDNAPVADAKSSAEPAKASTDGKVDETKKRQTLDIRLGELTKDNLQQVRHYTCARFIVFAVFVCPHAVACAVMRYAGMSH